MTVAELGRRMSSVEFSEWAAFYAVEPFGPAREDERAGVVAAVMGNSFRAKGSKAYQAADFFALGVVPTEPVNLGDKIRAALRAAAPRERKVRQVPRD